MSEYLTTNIPSSTPHPSVTVNDTAVGIGALVDDNTDRVQITIEGDVRVTYDGRTPSNTPGSEVGHILYDGTVLDESKLSAPGMLFVALIPGETAVLRITEFVVQPEAVAPRWAYVPWMTFLKRLARRRQVDILSGAFSYEWVGMATEFVRSRLAEVWHSAEWPTLMEAEERYYPDPDDKYLPWRQDGYEALPEDGIDVRRCIYGTKPQVQDPPTGRECSLSVRGIEVTDPLATANSCWVRYRHQCPEFTTEEYDENATYFYGDIVYDKTTGECYMSRMDDNQGNAVTTDYWSLQRMPALLADAVIYYVLADLLEEDGQHEKAGRQIAYADGFLMDLQERVFDNGGQTAMVAIG